jgi:transcriptional regulator with XRE-family HTH domain
VRKRARDRAGAGGGELLTRREAAEYLGVAHQTLAIWKCQNRYDIPVVKVGRLCKYRRVDLDRFLARNTIESESNDDLGLKTLLTPIARDAKIEEKIEPAIEFAEVKLIPCRDNNASSPKADTGVATLEVILPSGIKLRMGADCSLDLLSSVVSLLERQ